jgi:leucyl/phenylalanyl-tRNA--protein transferase
MLLTPELIITAYKQGYFPMSEPDGELYWHCPDPRAVIPLDHVIISRSLRKTLAKELFTIRINTDFRGVIMGCAERDETWISDDIIETYCQLHEIGYAHSVEAWHHHPTLGSRLVGGLYGVTLGGAFFGESMFSRMTDASKVAFIGLTERLRERGFTLLDSQYINPHMQSLGAIEIPRSVFLYHLGIALRLPCKFD